MREGLWIALAGVVILIVVVIRFAVRSERRLGTPTQRAALATLHTANLAAPALRTGLDKDSAERSISHLRLAHRHRRRGHRRHLRDFGGRRHRSGAL